MCLTRSRLALYTYSNGSMVAFSQLKYLQEAELFLSLCPANLLLSVCFVEP